MRADLDEKLGQLLKGRRRSLALTQADLALRSGLTARYIRKVECGQASPTVSVLVKLADALEISPAELMQQLMEA